MAKNSITDDPEYLIAKDSHKQFITHILNGKNNTEAYALAFPNASRPVCGSKGAVLRAKYEPLINRYVPLTPEHINKISEETIGNLTLMAFADVSEMFDKAGKPLPVKQMPKAIRMGITEVEVRNNKVSYKIGGKLKALEILAKIARLTDNQPEVSITIMTEEEKENKIKELLVRAVRRSDEENDN